MVIKTSHRSCFIARILSVVQAIQPETGSPRGLVLCSGVGPGLLFAELALSAMRNGISCTPMVNKGRSLWAGADGSSRSYTENGMFARMEMLYTGKDCQQCHCARPGM